MPLLSAVQSLPPSNNTKHIDSARKYTYVREKKPNRSPEIDKWNRNVGNPLGASYCGAFGYSMMKGCKHPAVRSGLARNYYTKSTYRFTAEDVLRGKAHVKKGDIIIWRRGSTVYGHFAFALKDWKGTSGWTIEGNTSSGRGSQYDGDGVFIRWRTIQPYNFFRIMGFVRVLY